MNSLNETIGESLYGVVGGAALFEESVKQTETDIRIVFDAITAAVKETEVNATVRPDDLEMIEVFPEAAKIARREQSSRELVNFARRAVEIHAELGLGEGWSTLQRMRDLIDFFDDDEDAE
jgi:hypothetical protein